MAKITNAKLWEGFTDSVVTVLRKSSHGDKIVKAISVMEREKESIMAAILTFDVVTINDRMTEVIKTINYECSVDPNYDAGVT